MSFDWFRKFVRGEDVVDCYSFVMTHDETLIEKKFRWDEAADSTARVLDSLIGFDTMTSAMFDYGITHPEKVAFDELSELARKNVGSSMIDAFSPFDRAFRHHFARVRYKTVFRKHERDCNIITFGSPSSNSIARAALGYLRQPGSKFRLRTCLEPERYPVRYELDDDVASVKRHGGRYAEPKWSISTPEAKLETRLTSDGRLTEDYLVISCAPNLMSRLVKDVLEARSELEVLRKEPDFEPRITTDREFSKRLEAIEDRADVDDSELHRILVIGGLHGPGTGSARLLLSDRKLAKLLERRVREERLDGKFWQAVLRVDQIKADPASGRDLPTSLEDRIDVFPINIA